MACSFLNLATSLKIFSSNEIEKAMLTMELKRLKKNQEMLQWPSKTDDLAVWSLDKCKHVLRIMIGIQVTFDIHGFLLVVLQFEKNQAYAPWC